MHILMYSMYVCVYTLQHAPQMMIVMEYLPEGDLREYLIHWSKKYVSAYNTYLQYITLHTIYSD